GGGVGEVEHLEKLVTPGDRLLPAQPVHGAGEVEQLGAGQALVEVELLREHPDAGLHLGWLLPGVELPDAGGALVGPKQPHDHADGGGLPRAVLAEQAVELTRLDGEVQVVDGGVLPEATGQSPGPHRGTRHLPGVVGLQGHGFKYRRLRVTNEAPMAFPPGALPPTPSPYPSLRFAPPSDLNSPASMERFRLSTAVYFPKRRVSPRAHTAARGISQGLSGCKVTGSSIDACGSLMKRRWPFRLEPFPLPLPPTPACASLRL